MSLALGIDIGTSGVRTAVITSDGTVVSMARADHLPQDPAKIDASLWWTSVKNCIRNQISALAETDIDPQGIERIAVDGTSGTMVLVNHNLAPVTRALMYNSKGFEAEAARIESCAPAAHITQGSASALGRAMRLMGEADGTARHLLHQADFVAACLSGVGGHSDFSNALKTGFDPETASWPDWLSRVGVDVELMPEVSAPGSDLARITSRVALELGLSQNAMIVRGTTDSIAAFLACAEPSPGVAVTSIGTTLAVKVMSQKRIDDPEIGLYSHRLGDAWLVGGASNTGGGVLRHYFAPDMLETLSGHIDPSQSSGLDYYPLLTPGERFPVNDPDLPPRLDPRPADDTKFLHGMLEGIANIERRAYMAIADRGGEYPSQVLTAGGGARNAVWRAMRQRILGVEVLSATEAEAAVGTAKLAAGLLQGSSA